jgi:hypothetical protein
MTNLFKTTNFEKYKIIAICIKAFTGIIGGSLVLSENHPYLTITVLGIGAVANEVVSYIKDKERK